MDRGGPQRPVPVWASKERASRAISIRVISSVGHTGCHLEEELEGQEKKQGQLEAIGLAQDSEEGA